MSFIILYQCTSCKKSNEFHYSFDFEERNLPLEVIQTQEIIPQEISLCETCFDKFEDWEVLNEERFAHFDFELRDNLLSMGVWLGLLSSPQKRARDY